MTERDSSDPGTERMLAADARHCWHPYTQHGMGEPFLPVVGAKDSVLHLADGREVIDGISSWWACLHGHGRPELVAAIHEQAERLDHVLFAGCTHEPAALLAEEICAVAPEGLRRVFFSDNGSTAVEVALKMVLQSWVHRGEAQRQVFVGLEGSYHGDTFGVMAVGDPDPFFLPWQPLFFESRRVPPVLDAFAKALEELGDRAAGVLVEPLVQGAAGMWMHEPEVITGLRALCDAHGVPLIADEVMTGFGRTGSLFACDQAGIAPDLICLAKGLTNGMLPLSLTLARDALFEDFLSSDRGKMFFHGHTFTANPIACTLARRSLEITLAEDAPGRLKALGARIVGALEPLRGLPQVADLRVRGGIVAVELHSDSPGYLASLGPKLRPAALERGVLLRPLGNVLYAMPPASTTDAQADHIAAVMTELVTEVAAAPD